MIERELAPDASESDVLRDSPGLAELVDEHKPEAAGGLGVRREQARSQA